MSFTFADNKLGGRLQTACDAIGAGHLRRAAGIFAELADDLNTEAEATDGLLGEEDEPEVPAPPPVQKVQVPVDLQSCGRNVHTFGPVDPFSGWRTCTSCGMVNVAPPDGGPVDMSIYR